MFNYETQVYIFFVGKQLHALNVVTVQERDRTCSPFYNAHGWIQKCMTAQSWKNDVHSRTSCWRSKVEPISHHLSNDNSDSKILHLQSPRASSVLHTSRCPPEGSSHGLSGVCTGGSGDLSCKYCGSITELKLWGSLPLNLWNHNRGSVIHLRLVPNSKNMTLSSWITSSKENIVQPKLSRNFQHTVCWFMNKTTGSRSQRDAPSMGRGYHDQDGSKDDPITVQIKDLQSITTICKEW
jgi:hypothetical protein